MPNSDESGGLIQELVHLGDLEKLTCHLKETLTNGSATSGLYKLRLGPDKTKIVHVQTKSKFFAFNPNTEPDFIMATHSIVE